MVEGISVRDGLNDDTRTALVALADLGGGHHFVRADKVVAAVMAALDRPLDPSVYPQVIALTWPSLSRHPLVQGRGNTGSRDFPPADPEYVELMLTPLGIAVVGLHTGDRAAGPIPVILMNGTRAFGGSFPGHNVTRIVAAALGVLADPEISDAVVGAILGPPDYSDGGVIVGGFDSLRDENAALLMRAEVNLRREPNSTLSVAITQIPPTMDERDVLEQVRDFVEDIPELELPAGEARWVAGGRWILPGRAVSVERSQRPGRSGLVVHTGPIDSEAVVRELRDRAVLETRCDVSVDVADGPATRGALVKAWVDDSLSLVADRLDQERARIANTVNEIEGLIRLAEHRDVVVALTEAEDDERRAILATLEGPPVRLTAEQAKAVAGLHPGSIRRPTFGADIDHERAEATRALRYVESLASTGSATRAFLATLLEGLPAEFGAKRCTQIRFEPTADNL